MKVGRKMRRFPYPPSIADCGLDSNQPLLPGGISTNSARDQSQSVLQFFDRLHWFICLLSIALVYMSIALVYMFIALVYMSTMGIFGMILHTKSLYFDLIQ